MTMRSSAVIHVGKWCSCNETTATVTGDREIEYLVKCRRLERRGEDVYRIRLRTIHSEWYKDQAG